MSAANSSVQGLAFMHHFLRRGRIPDFEQRYADVRLISATSVAVMMPLAFTQAC
jgi:hypothetical protein